MSATELSGYESVCAMFERQATRTPDAVAIACEGRAMTYREMDARVSQLARYLRRVHGVGPETIVALLLRRSERMLISMLGILKAGGAYLPITPEYPANRVACILGDATPTLVITESPHGELLSGSPCAQVSWAGGGGPWDAESTTRVDHEPGASQLAYVMYTSGSTGRPKGVMAEHGNLSNFIAWCLDEYRDSDFEVVYAGTPYGFDLSNIELYFALAIGCRIRMLPSNQMLGPYLKRDRKVLVNTVPSLVHELIKSDGILERVSVLNLGGEAVPPALLRALRSYPGLEIRNMYGPTETTSTAINYRMHGIESDEILIGRPIANTVVYVLDETFAKVPDGTRGEICIGGRGLTRGYWRRPELTRERFVDDPFRPGYRMYRTGDLGAVLPDGNLKFFGRNDNQVKIHGYRIELDEIGLQLATHPEVEEAIVGVRSGEPGRRLVAIIRAAGTPSSESLAEFLRAQLPSYMVPDEFLIVDRFPLTPTGKVDRSALFAEVS